MKNVGGKSRKKSMLVWHTRIPGYKVQRGQLKATKSSLIIAEVEQVLLFIVIYSCILYEGLTLITYAANCKVWKEPWKPKWVNRWLV